VQLRINSYVESAKEAAITLNLSVAIQKFYSLNSYLWRSHLVNNKKKSGSDFLDKYPD